MAKTRDYMDYLDDKIEIAPASSQEEYAAADTIAQVLQDHDLETSVEEFEAHPLGKLVQPILTCVLLIFFVIALLTEGPIHIVMLLLMVAIVALPLVEHFMGIKILENFGPSSRSQNVVAVHRATGDKVVKGARPIVIVAHYDTPRESLLYKQPVARYHSLLRTITVPCYIAIAVSLFFQILLFLPPVVRTVAWVVGLIALLPVLALSVLDILGHFANSTVGSNDNKSGVAALLAIANKVRPMPDRVSEDFEETEHKPARRRVADDSNEPAAPKYVEIVEEVKGVRHGADVLNSLGILPPSCEVVYKEPRVQVVEQMATEVISTNDTNDTSDETKASGGNVAAAATAVAAGVAAATVLAADEEETHDEKSVPEDDFAPEDEPVTEKVSDAMKDIPSFDEDEETDLYDDDLQDDFAGYDDESDAEDLYDDEIDYDEDADYDEDEEWEDSSIATVGAWIKDRVSNVREFFSKKRGSDIEIDKGEDRRGVDFASDEYEDDYDEYGAYEDDYDETGDNESYDDSYEEDVYDEEEYDEDADAEYEEAEFVEDADDQDYANEDDELEEEFVYEDADVYDDEFDEELDTTTYEVVEEVDEQEPVAYEGFDENILEEEAYEDALLAEEDFNDEVYEEESLEESLDEEIIEDEVVYTEEPALEDDYVVEEYVEEDVYEEDLEGDYEDEDEEYEEEDEYADFEYDEDEETYEDEDAEEYEEYEDEDEEGYEDAGEQRSGIGALISGFFSKIRGTNQDASDAYGAEDLFDQPIDEDDDETYEQYEPYDEDDEYEEYEEYEEDDTYETDDYDTEVGDDEEEYEYVEEYVEEEFDEDEESFEYEDEEEIIEEDEANEDGFVDADLEFEDDVDYENTPAGRAEQLIDPAKLHFDREEDPNIPRDTTGLDTISDSYDLYSGEVNRASDREKPEPLEDSSWGVSSYQPAHPAMNIARRAALFDLPDPSFASIDPFEDEDEYEEYDEYEDGGDETYEDSYEEVEEVEDVEEAEVNDVDYDEPAEIEEEPTTDAVYYSEVEEHDEEDEEDADEPTNNVPDNSSFWGSGRNTNWKGGATVRSDLRDYDMGDPLIIDADDLQDAILELGDDFLVAHDIWFVATGASEAGHAGIRAFIDEHRRDIRGAFLINLDSIGAGELSLLTREGLQSPRRADRRLVRMLDDIARDLHIGLKTTTYNFDERESATSMRSRVRSVTIAGLDENGLPAYSHTSDDVPENVDPGQVADVVRIVTELIRRS